MISFEEIRSRVTIQDILADCDFHPEKHRMACPIHGGKNPSSFSFTEDSFYCFSCGAKGGLIDLTELLLGKNRQDSLRYLAGKAGVQWQHTSGRKESAVNRVFPGKTVDVDLLNLELDMKGLEILRTHYTWRIRNAMKSLREENIDLSGYYSTIQYCEYVLEELDSEVIKTKCEISMKKKGQSNGISRGH